MEKLKTLLVANRGEISVRIIKTAKSLGIRTIAIYTNADAASTHVALADQAVLLPGGDARGYLDGPSIIAIALENSATAIIPGYGFLSENASFARAVASNNLAFVGPSPSSISSFGLKHTARELAQAAGVPIVPGTQGLLQSEDDAVRESEKLGFPVMLKATAGGGGMGLATCGDAKEVREAFGMVKSRGETLFKDAGVFVERFYPNSHHIEVQVFGNGRGDAIHFGERECSIQRRHQKVIEECPSPFVTQHPHLREKLCSAAVRLAKSVNYASAGTIEFLVDDATGDFFFLEMNTRLQVEHPITELCYDVDLVSLMLQQADAELDGSALSASHLSSLQPSSPPNGAAIEARIYAENPARDFTPAPGTLQIVSFPSPPGSRIDTWVHTGTVMSSHYDPLLAKAIFHSPTRAATLTGLHDLLATSRICGPPTNLSFLTAILSSQPFISGNTPTSLLSSISYTPPAIDVLSGGAYTLVEDYPGRPTMGRGFPHAGPMDPLAFQIANLLVGNARGTVGLEITLNGPELLFLAPAVVSLCGAPMSFTLSGKPVSMWTRVPISPGQKLSIGKTTGAGCRAYLAIFGGLPSIAEWFGSKSTSPGVKVGGQQGRPLAAGDLLSIVEDIPEQIWKTAVRLPDALIPRYGHHWDIMAMSGPYDEGYLLEEDVAMIYDTKWKVSHNAARGGIRLVGPKPKWARKDGGEGGAHPSNLIEYGYPLGTLNWTGDDPCIFPQDCPDFGGFLSSTTIVKADFWRMGQMKAGDTMQYHRISLEAALQRRRRLNLFIDQVAAACSNSEFSFDAIDPLEDPEGASSLPQSSNDRSSKAIIHQIPANSTDHQPLTTYRQGGDDYLLVEYGCQEFDINHRCRVTALSTALRESSDPLISFSNSTGGGQGGLINLVGCCATLLIYYDGTLLPQSTLLAHLVDLETRLGDLRTAKVPSRLFKLPITFSSPKQDDAIKRYMETQRPYASYLPDNMDFVARNNGLQSKKDLEHILLSAKLMAMCVGFFCALPDCLPVDPRQRLNAPKMNPSRVFTPEGQVSWGGSMMALYNVESPGGYMLTGLTIPGVDILGSKNGYTPTRPWLFEDFDQITFYEVSPAEYERQLALFHSGRYEYDVQDTVFDMGEHNRLLEETKGEVERIRKKQRAAQEEMGVLEARLMEQWVRERAEDKVPFDEVEQLLSEEGVEGVESPLNANVWKVVVEEGQKVEEGSVVAVLEAMKLEIAVRKEEGAATVVKILVRPNDVVQAGDALMLVKKAS